MSDKWIPIPQYEGFYEISERGEVRGVPRSVEHLNRTIKKKGMVLSPGKGTAGYLQVQLHRDGVRRGHKVHILVAIAFLGPRPPRAKVIHIDGVKHHNHYTNLRYSMKPGGQPRTKLWKPEKITEEPEKITEEPERLTEEDVILIRGLLALPSGNRQGLTQKQMIEELGVSRATIKAIKTGKIWPHLKGAIPPPP